MLLPYAVVAPLFFRGEIEFGVVTQGQSAFNHILSDISLVVYQVTSPSHTLNISQKSISQFKALAGYSAVVDRLGEFSETVSELEESAVPTDVEQIELHTANPPLSPRDTLLSLDHLTLQTPDARSVLIEELSFKVSL